MSNEFSPLQAIVQTGSVVLGWIVVHKLSVTRDLEKARRDMLIGAADKLLAEVTTILASALQYHTNHRNTQVEQAIKVALQDISSSTNLLGGLTRFENELRQCRSSIVDLKKSITGAHFEDEHNCPIPESSDQIQAIAADALRVKRCFERLKHRQFSDS